MREREQPAESRDGGTILLIGMGNEDRCDDAAGILVARAVEELALEGVDVRYVTDDVSLLMDVWSGTDTAIVVDAVGGKRKKGTIYRLDAGAGPVPSPLFHRSTHSFGVADAIELSRALGTLPHHLIVYGIEGGRFQRGQRLSPEVKRAVVDVADLIRRDTVRLRAFAGAA